MPLLKPGESLLDRDENKTKASRDGNFERDQSSEVGPPFGTNDGGLRPVISHHVFLAKKPNGGCCATNILGEAARRLASFRLGCGSIFLTSDNCAGF